MELFAINVMLVTIFLAVPSFTYSMLAMKPYPIKNMDFAY